MRRISSQAIQTGLIILLSLSAAVAVTWLVPSLSAAAVNMLFRFRGRVAPPEDIIVVGIDDASLQRVGKWPWPRAVMARALERITQAQPRAVGLDIVYAEVSDPSDDKLLGEAIKRNGRVVLPAQLVELETAHAETLRGASTWLLPLSVIKDGAAATGHAHADPDVDGVLRTVQLSKADASGARLWAFGFETLRVAEQISPAEIEERARSLRFGRYEIAIHDEAEQATQPGVSVIRPNEMIINYLGPPRTFHYYSIGDVLDGRVPAQTFKDKIVLVGAVAQTMGDTRTTPFISYSDADRQSGTGMPGVEVHANVIETIRRGAWLSPRPDWIGFSIALVVILLACAIVRLLDGWREVAGLCALLSLIVVGSLYAFNRYFIIPPMVPMLSAFFTVVPLLLLNRSLTASRDLDRKLDKLARIQKRFLNTAGRVPSLREPALPVSLPRNLTWKLRAVDEITSHLVARISFMNQVFSSMTDGLLVADITGRVVFANPAALPFWACWDGLDNGETLAGKSLTELFVGPGIVDAYDFSETMRRVIDGQNVLLDLELLGREGRFYTLQFSTVHAGNNRQPADAERARPIGLIVIITDVTKRRELERVKAETLQLVSHELRTPLTSIRALSELLLKYPVPEDQSPEILETLYSEAVRMNELINRYLDVTKIESGTHLLARKAVPVNNLISECVRLLGSLAAEKSMQINLRLEEPSPLVYADAQLLTQAFSNLLSNAIKYSPAGSCVEIGSALVEDGVRVYVRDEGYGIPHESQGRVFEKFYRLERDAKSETVGTGLGLPLVKEIIERHGGQVTLESEPERGSTFTIHLPLQTA